MQLRQERDPRRETKKPETADQRRRSVRSRGSCCRMHLEAVSLTSHVNGTHAAGVPGVSGTDEGKVESGIEATALFEYHCP